MNKEAKVKIILNGIGAGSGDTVEVLPEEKIREIIKNLSGEEIFRTAMEGHVQGYLDGVAVLYLENGHLGTESFSTGETNQPIDAVYVELYRIKNYTHLTDVFGVDEEDELEDAMFYDLYDWVWDEIDDMELDEQLSYFYEED